MKHLFLKSFVIAAALTQAVSSYAAPGITFDGPKITDGKISRPGQFSVYQFMGTDKVDAAVPTIRRLWGLDNKNNWPSATPNTYFDPHAMTDGDLNHHALAGQFNGDGAGAKDIVTADYLNLHFFYDYTGAAASGESGDLNALIDDKTRLTIWGIAVADFNGDGKDDVAVIGYDAKTWQGYLAVYAGTNAGGANPLDPKPYYVQPIKNGIPLSLAVGNFGGDNKPDIVVATMIANPLLPDGAFGNTFTNTGTGFDYKDHSFNFARKECDKPTGLIAYNPDGAGQDDLVLTCYDRFVNTCEDGTTKLACNLLQLSGPVVSLENNGTGTGFAVKQTIGIDADPAKTLKFPYSSTVGDYNGDSHLDLAVASNQGQAVVTFAGTAPFQVDLASRNDISALSYLPKYIQTHDMNGDGLPDLILTTTGVNFPVQPKPNDEISVIAVIDTVRFPVNAVKKGEYFKGDASYAWKEGMTANKFSDIGEARAVASDSANHYRLNYVANYAGKYNEGLVYTDTPGLEVMVPNRPIGEVAVPEAKPTDGVLVLINHRPTVSGDDPKCGGGDVTYRCTATDGNTITECAVTTTDSAVTSTPAVAGPGGKEWTGKVHLPNDTGIHKWTVTGKDNLGTVSSGDFTADFSNCPGGKTECPAQAIEKQLSPKDPVMICAFENDAKLADLNAGKTVTWTQVGTGKGIDMSSFTTDGQCLVGPRLPLSFDQERVIDLKYSVTPDGPSDCPARFVFPKAFFEGSGSLLGCSLNTATDLSVSWVSGISWLLPAGALAMARMRRRKK
ncbi:MAG: VCBS repeat-containing protein [Deltaproteobacteria bacterium]|nr:VCBS repeat-containing protein [Deltaproteobacteria bacterium]